MRDEHYENFLRHYHSSLSDIVTKLGSDPEKLFNFANLKQQMKRCGKYAFLNTPFMVQIMLVDPKDVPSIDEISTDADNGTVSIVPAFNSDKQLVYKKRIQDVMNDLVESGLYWN